MKVAYASGVPSREGLGFCDMGARISGPSWGGRGDAVADHVNIGPHIFQQKQLAPLTPLPNPS